MIKVQIKDLSQCIKCIALGNGNNMVHDGVTFPMWQHRDKVLPIYVQWKLNADYLPLIYMLSK